MKTPPSVPKPGSRTPSPGHRETPPKVTEPLAARRISASPFESWPYIERRSGKDRRGKPTTLLSTLFGPGRRRAGRRLGETENIYVDIYHKREILVVVAILVLNVLDAYFTLDYIGEKNGSEANPVANHLLLMGDHWFIGAKSCLVALCLVFLLVHKNFRYVRGAMWILLVFYAILLLYHVFLQVHYHLTH